MQHLTKSELSALLIAAKMHSEADWLMILVAYGHGLRCSEVIQMTGDQVRDGYLTVQRLKGSMKTTQPLMPDEQEALERMAKAAGSNRMFPHARNYFWRKMQKYGRMANIPEHKLHPHILKHSIAMHTIKGAGIENVRQYLGHKSIASTGAYLKVTDEAASKAIAAAAGEE